MREGSRRPSTGSFGTKVEKIPQGLGQRARARRKLLRMTVWEMAERCGIDEQTLGFLERGDQCPTLPTAARLANGLGMTLDELVFGWRDQ